VKVQRKRLPVISICYLTNLNAIAYLGW